MFYTEDESALSCRHSGVQEFSSCPTVVIYSGVQEFSSCPTVVIYNLFQRWALSKRAIGEGRGVREKKYSVPYF